MHCFISYPKSVPFCYQSCILYGGLKTQMFLLAGQLKCLTFLVLLLGDDHHGEWGRGSGGVTVGGEAGDGKRPEGRLKGALVLLAARHWPVFHL